MLLHISYSISKLLRYMTYMPGCNLIEKGRLVLVLKIHSEERGSHCTKFIISVDWKIRNFLLGMGSIL